MKKNRINLIAALATAVFSLSSCIYDDEVSTYAPNGELSQEEVKISASMQGVETTTRAAYNLQGDNLADWSKAGIFVYKTGQTAAVAASTGVTGYAGYANIAVNSPTTGAATPTSAAPLTLTPASSLYFPIDKTAVDVYVYAPRDASYTDVTSMAFTVDADQSTDAKYIASDFIYGKATAVYSGATSPAVDKRADVTMYHALTKLTFKITEDGSNAAGITQIKLKDVYKKATINMSTAINTSAPWLTAGTQVTTSSTASDMGNVIVSNSTDNTNLYADVLNSSTATGNGVSAIIPAQSGMSDTAGPKVEVTIDGQSKEAYLGSSTFTAFEPGKEYIYTLNIKATGVVVVVVSVVDWIAGASQSRDLTF